MSLSVSQQVNKLINEAKHILITTNENDSGDSVCAGLALKKYLQIQNKPCDIATLAPTQEKIKFLNPNNEIKNNLPTLKKMIIEIDTKDKKINELNYDTSNDKLNIFIAPEEGELRTNDVQINYSDFKYDLIITLGSADLESIGSIYYDHSDFFYKTSIINIDRQASNEHYGQVNLVDLNKSSISEIIFDILKTLNKNIINKEISTLLLAGIMIGTRNFRSPHVSPDTLSTSAELIKEEADRERIIAGMSQHKDLPTLNLWGRVLARLKEDLHYKLAWSLISQNDFIKSGSSSDNLDGVVEEIINNSPSIETVVLFFEKENNKISAKIYTTPTNNALRISAKWHGVGNSQLSEFELPFSKINEAENEVINSIRPLLQNQ